MPWSAQNQKETDEISKDQEHIICYLQCCFVELLHQMQKIALFLLLLD